ncbi:MAG: hypothetical protein HOL04_12210 [Gammaproteobacteria bacterium]|jgi:hypothetical protein|nr:hypothetical protein [Gammaproteobacteria bacterium]MBT4606710.1 hypothetical protein [Thiotrichales bacterium]MBT3966590.1 hypothetical protein [Gammaproteobacteria bacterium]MBT4080740.1 hypothetical protein [Gammaproteobacteria bacterium]MBT4330449.1 hypothetical protein [Gammaproteobacteria bacterium]
MGIPTDLTNHIHHSSSLSGLLAAARDLGITVAAFLMLYSFAVVMFSFEAVA